VSQAGIICHTQARDSHAAYGPGGLSPRRERPAPARPRARHASRSDGSGAGVRPRTKRTQSSDFPPMHRLPLLLGSAGVALALFAGEPTAGRATDLVPRAPPPDSAGRGLYRDACANCHGVDGTGVSNVRLGLETPLPDFTDCNFASREPDADWVAVDR